MKLREAINRLVKRMGIKKEESDMQQLPAEFQKLIGMVEKTQEIELSCDEVYHLLDQYTEVVDRGDNAQKLMPLVEHHIDICPDCREEFEALLRILQAAPA
jgi:predicted transcriptional regulator